MNKLILLLFLSCASAKNVPIIDFSKRIYVTCPKEWAQDNLGKLCYRQCKKETRVMKKCYEWYLDIRDMNDPQNYGLFRNFEFKIPN